MATEKKTWEHLIVLGHSGFIGQHIINFFKTKYPEKKIEGISFPEIDLTKKEDVETINVRPDSIVIMLSCIKRDFGDNTDNFLSNTHMVANICKKLEKTSCKQFIFFSSAAVYGEDNNNLEITENTKIDAKTYYGLAKYVGENLLKKTLSEKTNAKLTIIRPPVIYGPGDGPCYGPSGFTQKALKNEQITLWGDGTELREFIYIEDVVKILDQLIKISYNGTLNLASGTSNTFKDVLDLLETLVGDIDVSKKERTKDKVDHKFNNTLIKQALPNIYFTPLKEGLIKTMEYLKKQTK